MLLGNRQAKYGCASVPPIEFSKVVDVSGYETIRDAFAHAIWDKMSTNKHWGEEYEEKEHIKKLIEQEKQTFYVSVEQTIHFLKHIGALKPSKKIQSIELWKEGHQMPPFYEGINAQLKTMLVNHFYPRTAEELDKGRIYASYNLDQVSESVLYTMEYFQKEKLLKDPDDCDMEKIKEWLDKWNTYYQKNKEKIKAKNKVRRAGFKQTIQEMENISKKLSDMACGIDFGKLGPEQKMKERNNIKPGVIPTKIKQPKSNFPKQQKQNFKNVGRFLR